MCCMMQVGETPLHMAAQQGRDELVRKLLEWGADSAIRIKVRNDKIDGWHISSNVFIWMQVQTDCEI